MRNPDLDNLHRVAFWAALFLVGYGLGKLIYRGLILYALKKGPW